MHYQFMGHLIGRLCNPNAFVVQQNDYSDEAMYGPVTTPLWRGEEDRKEAAVVAGLKAEISELCDIRSRLSMEIASLEEKKRQVEEELSDLR